MAHVVLYYHIIWRTKRSERTIQESHERELYAYILGYCQKKKCTLIRIGGMADHIHMLVSIRPDIAVSDFMQVLKTETSKWMKDNPAMFPKFAGWGNGYAAFSYCERDKEMIRHYIMNQKEHHRQKSFHDEYVDLLKEWGIDHTLDRFLSDD
ncbi:MAG: IS200/IS605 family transposase [Bacteroidales bacterium]|nr:IS200/IS605 family transposase [Bacteroidales bacterium]